MPTFEDFAHTVKITAQDKGSTKRLEEILTVLKDKKAYKDMTPQKAVEILEQLGPTFVKMGQLMSDRTDVIPKEYCDAFATLRDDSNPIPFDEILDILNKNYAPKTVDDIFSTIEPEPIGSASIAQVHKAKLKDGMDVAVKIRRPGIKETMEEDIELIQHLIAVAQLISKKHGNILLTVSGFVDEIAKTTQQEVNLGNEMDNLLRFQKELANSGGEARGISSPAGFQEISSESVLVMEYISGDELAAIAKDANKAHQYDLDDIAMRIAQNYIEQFLDWGFFTSDPHMGNIILRKNNEDERPTESILEADGKISLLDKATSTKIALQRTQETNHSDVEITWIDMGMMGKLNSVERDAISQVFASVAKDDAFSLRRALVPLTIRKGEVNDSALLEMLSSVLSKYRTANLADVNVGDVLTEVLDVLHNQNLVVTPSMTMLVRGLIVIEGVLAQISPSTSIIEIVSNHVMKEEIKPEKLALRARNLAGNVAGSIEASAKIPTQISNTLDMLEMGELTLTGKLDVSDKTLSTIYASISRLCLAMLSVGLFLGSALICLTDMEPKVLGAPLLGVLGFIGATVLGIYLLVKIVQSRHAMSNHEDPRA